MSKASDKAIAQLEVLAASLRELSIRQKARRWKVSAQTAAKIVDPARPIVLGNTPPWSKMQRKSLRRKLKWMTEARRSRTAKSAEKIFAHERPNDPPSWYVDSAEPLPARLVAILVKQ
jgi:hypothetical protein